MAAFDGDSDIEGRLENLRGELETYGKDIKGLVESIYGSKNERGDVLTNIDLKNSPFQLITLLRQEVVEIVEESQKQEEVISQAQTDIKFCNDMSGILSTIASIIDLMNHFEDALINFRFNKCLEYLSDIEEQLALLPDEEKLLGKGKICRSLRNEYKLQKVRISSKVLRLLNECISVDHGIVKVSKTLTGYIRCEDKIIVDSIALDDLLALAVSCDVIEEYMDKLVESVWVNLFTMLWKEKKTQIPNITSTSVYAEIIFVSGNKNALISKDSEQGRAAGNFIASNGSGFSCLLTTVVGGCYRANAWFVQDACSRFV